LFSWSDATLHVGSISFGASSFAIQPWRLDIGSWSVNWFFHVKVCIECLPLHAWSAKGIRQGLGDVCVCDHMEAESYQQESTEMFCFFTWMSNPDLVP
jgi:hypothetical protein